MNFIYLFIYYFPGRILVLAVAPLWENLSQVNLTMLLYYPISIWILEIENIM